MQENRVAESRLPVENETARRKPPFVVIGIAAVAVLVGGTIGVRWWMHQQAFVSTEDAMVAGNLVTVSSRIPGKVSQLMVDEGQSVKAGQVVAILDKEDLQAQLKQAEAALAVAQTGLETSNKGVSLQSDQTSTQITQADAQLKSAQALLRSAQANADKSRADYERISDLYAAGAVAKQNCDAAKTALTAADAALASAKNQVATAQAAYGLSKASTQAVDIKRGSVKQVQAQIKQATAAVEMAKLQLAHAEITSPVNGTVARRMANTGEMVTPGQGLFSVSESDHLWISAYIEETKIRRVRPDSPVDIRVDAFPGKLFHGVVSEVGAVTGGQFSLLPANNAAGNFTKVVQRIPVRIRVPEADGLKPGMSVVIDIASKG